MSATFEEHTVATVIHGRYLIERGQTGAGAPLLVGCHGYAENAERHLEKLRQIPGSERWVLCAVQGLHRFYSSKTGEIRASWMTRQDREQAIDDNVRYVAAVVAEVRRRFKTSDRLVFAGFSQGVAMAFRAAARSGFASDALLALAADVPPDVAAARQGGFPPVLLGRGTQDQWYDEGKMERDLETLQGMGVEVTPCVFEGGHDWSPEFYSAAGEVLARVADPS